MYWFKNIYNNLFLGFLVSIVIVFFATRALDSPFHRVISGDGFGYYAYLPAKYIYNDSNYEFKWFNKVYTKNYSEQNYKSADDNFLIPFNNKRINKYYPGVALLWLPFFITAHFLAEVSGYPADGYSYPYQVAIALASLVYLLIGLIFIRKLLLKLFDNVLTAFITPVFIFYGTYLFHYSINLNSYSHIYSLAFISMFFYYSFCYFNKDNSVKYLLLSLFCLCVVVAIRPINIMSVLVLPAFIPFGFFKQKLKINNITYGNLAVLLLIVLFIYNHLHTQYTQSGSFFTNTYSNEKFYLNKPKLYDVLFSYHAGLFVYSPLIFISLFGSFFFHSIKKSMVFLSLLFIVIYIYSSWWYWPITSRALIDYYVLIAILLASFIYKIQQFNLSRIFFIVIILACFFYQLKNYQLKNGILDGNLTHKELFLKNFFRVKKTNQYVIPPKTILKQFVITDDYEKDCTDTLKKIAHSGKCAAVLDTLIQFTKPFTYKIPEFFNQNGIKKIRISFWTYFQQDISSCPIYLYFYDKDNKELGLTSFFINESIEYNVWDKKEFGWEFGDSDLGQGKIDHITWFVRNNELKNKVFIDDVKTEFILCDRSYEIVQ